MCTRLHRRRRLHWQKLFVFLHLIQLLKKISKAFFVWATQIKKIIKQNLLISANKKNVESKQIIYTTIKHETKSSLNLHKPSPLSINTVAHLCRLENARSQFIGGNISLIPSFSYHLDCLAPRTQNINWTYIKCLIYILCPRGRLFGSQGYC